MTPSWWDKRLAAERSPRQGISPSDLVEAVQHYGDVCERHGSRDTNIPEVDEAARAVFVALKRLGREPLSPCEPCIVCDRVNPTGGPCDADDEPARGVHRAITESAAAVQQAKYGVRAAAATATSVGAVRAAGRALIAVADLEQRIDEMIHEATGE